MSDTKVGVILEPGVMYERDAIHVAIAPVAAAQDLFPGQRVGWVEQGHTVGVVDNPLGIVDPFLPSKIKKGTGFWMFLFPQTVTGMKHHWEHPAFIPDVEEIQVHAKPSPFKKKPKVVQDLIADLKKSAAKKWLMEYADSLGVTFSQLIDGAKGKIEHGDYLIGGDEMEGNSTSKEFWLKYQEYTEEDVPEEKQGNFFSCSC